MKIFTSRWFMAIAGLIVGAALILVIRLATYKPAESIHYHANFAMYINGQQEKFKNDFYYQEVEVGCTAERKVTPHERAHLHDNVYDVIHVEDHAVTWGQFFQNIGWDINPWFVKTTTQILMADTNHPVTFILNGKTVPTVVNTVIGDRDKLLVDYGTSGQDVLQQEYKNIPSTAAHYDVTPDPESCSGSKGVTFSDRLRHMF